MKKGELNKKQQKCREGLGYNVVLNTAMTTVICILVVMMLIFVGVKMATGESNTSVASNEDITVRQVLAEEDRFNYQIEDANLNKDDSGAVILSNLNTKYGGTNYAVIESKTQLSSLLDTYAAITGSEANYYIDSSFFETGSIVAIAIENKAYTNLSMPSITRDANYNLTATIDAKRVTDDEIDEQEATTSTLFLVQIQNIQPQSVVIDFNEDTSSEY